MEKGKGDMHNENLKGKSSQKSSMLAVGCHRSNSKRLPGASLWGGAVRPHERNGYEAQCVGTSHGNIVITWRIAPGTKLGMVDWHETFFWPYCTPELCWLIWNSWIFMLTREGWCQEPDYNKHLELSLLTLQYHVGITRCLEGTVGAAWRLWPIITVAIANKLYYCLSFLLPCRFLDG